MQDVLASEDLTALDAWGFVRIPGPFARPADAWRTARAVIDATAATKTPIAVIGDFVIPPPEGPPSRDFQTLHLDFGLPLAPVSPSDIARFTALHVHAEAPMSDAVTRLVPLGALLGSGRWPDRVELLRRFAAYGDSHGMWDADAGYVEGSLARIVEAALGQTPVLPSVRNPGFLCGTEFATLAEEVAFFTQRGLRIDAIAIEIWMQPGELLVFDNLGVAHGRRGTRQPGELRQRLFGHRMLSVEQQIELRDRVLAAFI
jgi:hypothetical protein